MRPIAEGLRPLVKGRVLESFEVEPERTTNFGHIFMARPGAVLEPAHAEDVAAAIAFARGEGIPVSVRGAAHSQSRIAISNGGILIDMRSMGRIGPVARGASSVEVEGGAIWRDVTRATLRHRLAPPVLTNNLSVTVGGTLSTAGVGVASHRYGTQGDQVEELTVVTGAGDVRTCGPDRDSDLFDAVIAGLGQVGVITSARLKLRAVRPMTRTYYLLYDDAHRFMEDTKSAMDSGRWDHLESWASPSPQGTKPVNGRRQVFARWFFPFHPTVEFDTGSPPDDRALLDGLHPYDHLYTDDLPILDFFERLEPVFDLWKRGGTWGHVHPWMEVVLPWERTPDVLEAVLPDLPPAILVGGHVLLWPAKGSTSRSKLFRRPQGEDLMGFGILPAIPAHFWEEAKPMLENLSRLVVAMGGNRYLSGYVDFDDEAWRAHYGDTWAFFEAAKRRHDPDGILNPGFVPLRGAAAPARKG
ncbi:MAG TPA: FAD-binding protein [Candidatus Eisenbacteria bacterium]|nr:FAD-binding protein [Candidatus Eisenbacteria bacterium]